MDVALAGLIAAFAGMRGGDTDREEGRVGRVWEGCGGSLRRMAADYFHLSLWNKPIGQGTRRAVGECVLSSSLWT